MVRENEIRKAEVAVPLPPTTDAGLMFIGRIRHPGPREWRRHDRAGLTGRFAKSRYSNHGYRHSPVWRNTNELKCLIGCTFPVVISSCKARRMIGLREVHFH
jgi:hypothetical protein